MIMTNEELSTTYNYASDPYDLLHGILDLTEIVLKDGDDGTVTYWIMILSERLHKTAMQGKVTVADIWE